MDTVEPDSFHYIVIGIGHNASGKMRANQNTYGSIRGLWSDYLQYAHNSIKKIKLVSIG